jgi:SpoVK/Ycf46/Vps4 family AAA+-type ATPase
MCVEHLPGLVPALILHGALAEAPADRRPVQLIDPGKLSMRMRAELWGERARAGGLRLSEEGAQKLAAMARLDEAQIDLAIGIAKGFPGAGKDDDFDRLCAAVRRLAREGAPAAVQVVECAYGWDDIVLPQETMDRLRDLSNQVRFSSRVREDWSFDRRMPYGRGVAALFSGPSGTGKSMAAQIIACDLCSALYRVDLSKTMSKWLGETEKILSHTFNVAQRNSAVLFFDEADVLFAKRTEVKDAHDRYANVEVAYLLQRMEDYDGLAILTTNLKQNIDPAFLRRLRFVVDFPMPDPEQRLKIWKLAFPKDAPLARDIDFALLARRLALTGGNIQQIAIGSAFIAAAVGSTTITMQHIVRATRQELLKLGMASAAQHVAEVEENLAPIAEARA